jgi:hypothetical protein
MAIPSNCITIDAEMYGIIPNAKIEAFENAPPENILSSPINPELPCCCKFDNIPGSTPGNTINDPNL